MSGRHKLVTPVFMDQLLALLLVKSVVSFVLTSVFCFGSGSEHWSLIMLFCLSLKLIRWSVLHPKAIAHSGWVKRLRKVTVHNSCLLTAVLLSGILSKSCQVARLTTSMVACHSGLYLSSKLVSLNRIIKNALSLHAFSIPLFSLSPGWLPDGGGASDLYFLYESSHFDRLGQSGASYHIWC